MVFCLLGKYHISIGQINLLIRLFLWDSGLFCFNVVVFLEELTTFNPVFFEASKIL